MAHWLRSELKFKELNWYKPYEKLNQMPIPPSSLLKIQTQAIKKNNSKTKKEIDILNSFLQDLQKFYISQINSNDESDFFQVFLKTLNSGYVQTGGFDGKKPIQDLQFIQDYENNILKFLKYISDFSGKEVPESIKYDLERIIVHLKKQDFYGFRARKADLWENLAVWILQIAGFSAINTGALIDAAGKQLVQDVGAFLNPENLISNKSNNGFINFQLRITGTKSKKENSKLLEYLQNVAKTEQKIISDSISLGNKGYINFQVDTDLKGFEDLISQASHTLNKKITIKVEDEFQERLAEGMTVQAKSGAHQSLLNNQKRDQITSNQLVEWDKYLKILQQFYINTKFKDQDVSSKTLEAYSNWIFSKNLAKTTLGKNKFFLSHYGFKTLDELMVENNIGFTLSPNPNTLKLVVSTGIFNIEETNNI